VPGKEGGEGIIDCTPSLTRCFSAQAFLSLKGNPLLCDHQGMSPISALLDKTGTSGTGDPVGVSILLEACHILYYYRI